MTAARSFKHEVLQILACSRISCLLSVIVRPCLDRTIGADFVAIRIIIRSFVP